MAKSIVLFQYNGNETNKNSICLFIDETGDVVLEYIVGNETTLNYYGHKNSAEILAMVEELKSSCK